MSDDNTPIINGPQEWFQGENRKEMVRSLRELGAASKALQNDFPRIRNFQNEYQQHPESPKAYVPEVEELLNWGLMPVADVPIGIDAQEHYLLHVGIHSQYFVSINRKTCRFYFLVQFVGKTRIDRSIWFLNEQHFEKEFAKLVELYRTIVN